MNQILKIVFQAYEICISRDLMREQVFILGRMGNSKQALAVIINKLGDIEEVFHLFQLEVVFGFNQLLNLESELKGFYVEFEVVIILHRL